MGLSRMGISALVLCATGVSVAPAQRAIDFGVMAGGTFSKFGGSDKGDFDKVKVGTAGGIFATLGITPQFAVQPEILFAQKGGKNEVDDVAFKISYVQVPVLLKFRIPAKGEGSQFSPHAYGGGAFGLRSGCSVKSGTTTTTCKAIGADVKLTEFSLVFGAGVEIGRALIDARFDLGLSKIDDSATPDDVKNRTFYLLAGWTFRTPR